MPGCAGATLFRRQLKQPLPVTQSEDRRLAPFSIPAAGRQSIILNDSIDFPRRAEKLQSKLMNASPFPLLGRGAAIFWNRPGVKVVALLALISPAASSLMAQEAQRLPGMQQEIEIKPAKDLKIKAPSGKYVAVLDQSLAAKDSTGPKVQDHHNGWLGLSAQTIEGDVIKVKGKYFIPGSTEAMAAGIRLTVRKRSPAGLAVYSDKTLKLDQLTGQWIDFEIELPLEDVEARSTEFNVRPDAKYCLLLSAVPFAGPVYLDNLQVTDPQGNQLWEFPEFEPE